MYPSLENSTTGIAIIHRQFKTILSIKWTVTTSIFFMLKETTSESTTSIKMSEATTTDAESKLNYIFKKLIKDDA